jgi:hypothetical protein
MSEDFDIKQRTENIQRPNQRRGSENNKKISDKHSRGWGDA